MTGVDQGDRGFIPLLVSGPDRLTSDLHGSGTRTVLTVLYYYPLGSSVIDLHLGSHELSRFSHLPTFPFASHRPRPRASRLWLLKKSKLRFGRALRHVTTTVTLKASPPNQQKKRDLDIFPINFVRSSSVVCI
jgi:hypothetical protein